MRLLPLAALLLLNRSAARGAEPAPTEPEQPKCEVLLAEPRPEPAEKREAWDACKSQPASRRDVLQGFSAPDPEAIRREESAAQGTLAARTRMRNWSNPFANAGSVEPPGQGGPGYGQAGSADPGLYTSRINSVGAGGPAGIDRTVPPLSRVDQAFAALEQPGTSAPYVLAANAAWTAVAPQPWAPVMDWTFSFLPRYVSPPMELSVSEPVAGPDIPASRFARADEPSPWSGFGAGVSGAAASAKNLRTALPSMNFKAMVTSSMLSAWGAAPWIKAITIDYKPQTEKQHDRSGMARVDIGHGAVTGFVAAGYEESISVARTKGKAVVSEKTVVPVKAGFTYSFSAGE